MSVIHFVSKLKLLPCFKKKESFAICEALPHPVPSQEKKGLCVYGEGSVNRVHKYTSAGGRAAWGARFCPPLPRAGSRVGRPVARTGAPGRRGPGCGGGRGCGTAGDERAGPGRTDLRGTQRAPAGAQAALCPRPLGSRGVPLPSTVAPTPSPDSMPAPPRVLALRRWPFPLSASERRTSRLPAAARPRFPGRRLGKVEEEEKEEAAT